MAIGRGRLERKILEKAPRKGRKKVSKKKTPKVAAKPRVIEDIQIDIPEIINIPGIGQIELPKAKPKPKKKVKTPKKGSKAKSRPTPKPRPVKLPDISIDEGFREDLRIDPGMLEGLIQKPVKEKFKKEVEPIIGAVSDGRLDDYSPPVLPKFPKPGDPDIDLRLGIPGESGRGGINPGMGVYRPDGTEYRLADPDFDYQAMVRGEYLTEKPIVAPPKTGGPVRIPGDPGGPIIDVGRDPSPDLPPAPEPPIRVDTTPEPAPPPPPQFVDMDPLKGMRETIIPRNILGQSFDSSVRDDYEKQMQAAQAAMMQPGGNIRATEYPTYQTPTLAVPQTQFGGYGQPMPIAPLLPYAGLASATMPEQIIQQRPPASGARVNPGTGQIEPIGVAPDPGLVNLPPGVTGPIR